MNLAGERGGEVIDEADVLGDLVVGDLALAKGANLFLGGFKAGAQANPCDDDFAEAGVGDADDLDFADFGIGVEELLHFAGVDVFTAANDDVAGAAGEVDAAVVVHDAEVAGVQPAIAVERPRRDGRPGDHDLPLLPISQPFSGSLFRIGYTHPRTEQGRAGT